MASDWSNPLDPDHESLAQAALKGLFAGDLQPLAAYLLSDFELDPVVRRLLADLIEGIEGLPYRVDISCDGRAHQKLETALEDVWIVSFVLREERKHPGREAAVNAAKAHFDLSERRIRRALARAPKGSPKST